MLVDVPYISMPNIIMDQEVFPEFIQSRARAEILVEQALFWLENPDKTAAVREILKSIQTRLGQKKASATSAELIVQALNRERS